MTVPFGPFRLVVSISLRCREHLREHLMIARAQGATDAELARMAGHGISRADLVRVQAEQMMYGSRLV